MQSTPPTKPIITIDRISHRGADIWALRFPYNLKVKEHLMKFTGMRWSKTHRCFYLAASAHNLRLLQKHCLGVVQFERGAAPVITRGTAKRSVTEPQKSKIPHATLVKIEGMRKWMQQKRYASATIETYVSFMTQFFAMHQDLPWDGITKDVIVAHNHAHFIKGKRSYSAQNQWINAVKLYLKVHGDEQKDLEDIERPRKVSTLPNILTQAEVRRLFQHTPNLKHRALMMLIYSAGLRIGEALSLKPRDIRSAEGLIYIRGGKGQKDRRVPLSVTALKVLRQYYDAYQPKQYLFEGIRGGRYSSRSASQVLQRSLKRAGISGKVTLHTLRHSYATHLTNRGVNIQYLQEILGHNSPKTTMLYTHLSGKDIKDIKSPLDDMDV